MLLAPGPKSHTYILARKKCRKSPYAVMMEEPENDIVVLYPVARGGNQSKTNESSPYASGVLGHSTQMTGPGRSPVESHDLWPDPSAALIDVSDVGLPPKTPAFGSLGTMYGAPTRFGRKALPPITEELVNVLPEYMA